jgi:hypothetical protein
VPASYRAVRLDPLHRIGRLGLRQPKIIQVGELPRDDVGVGVYPFHDTHATGAEPAVAVVHQNWPRPHAHAPILQAGSTSRRATSDQDATAVLR